MNKLTLYGPYLANLTGRRRYIQYMPEHPEATWWIAVEGDKQYYNSIVLVHPLEDGSWEQAYAGCRFPPVHDEPYSTSALEVATLCPQDLATALPNGGYILMRAAKDLIRNRPFRERANYVGLAPLVAPPGVHCCQCGQPAVVTLCSHNNGTGITSHVQRDFCRACLTVGESVTHGICHLCRQRPADIHILSVAHSQRDTGYDFRVHLGCVRNLDQLMKPRTPLAERRPLRLTTTPSEEHSNASK